MAQVHQENRAYHLVKPGNALAKLLRKDALLMLLKKHHKEEKYRH